MQGNIEYKLKLTDISPARFARLVTQLKWRLLEGGGQAYYELGVADSGALIGLSRADLEQSLETLEMMAGEIGASVIVVKEIEVPPAMVVLADKVSAYIDPETGEWTEKMHNKRHRASQAADSDSASTPNSVEEADTDDLTDSDETCSAIATPDFPSEQGSVVNTLLTYVHRFATSNPNRPVTQSSPSIYPIDDDLALFSMEPEPSLDDPDTEEEELMLDALVDVPALSLDIEITPVYKPRPVRKRASPASGPVTAIARPPRRAHKHKHKKQQQPWHTLPSLTSNTAVFETVALAASQEDKALQKRLARDKRREEKRTMMAPLVESGAAAIAGPLDALPRRIEAAVADDPVSAIVDELHALHVEVQSANAVVLDPDMPIDKHSALGAANVAELLTSSTVGHVKTLADAKEPRLIVEAMVVRKLSLEEGFLDLDRL